MQNEKNDVFILIDGTECNMKLMKTPTKPKKDVQFIEEKGKKEKNKTK
jgi:hypothetical protein